MYTVDVQLWGGPQDGLRAKVEVGQFSGPPSFVDVPEAPSRALTILMPRAEAGDDLNGVPTIRYRLVSSPTGGQIIYRLERKTKT